MEIPQLLVHDHRDNVGVVVVEDLAAGTDLLCVVTEDDSDFPPAAQAGRADRPQGRAADLKSATR